MRASADILAVALGAPKAHLWLQRNQRPAEDPDPRAFRRHDQFPGRHHTGARRCACAKCGLEWLWRIKEEPRLWRRYLTDGVVLGRLMVTQVIPLVVLTQWHRLRWRRADEHHDRTVRRARPGDARRFPALPPSGTSKKPPRYLQAKRRQRRRMSSLTSPEPARSMPVLSAPCSCYRNGSRNRQRSLTLTAVPRPVERLFRLNGFTFLLLKGKRVRGVRRA